MASPRIKVDIDDTELQLLRKELAEALALMNLVEQKKEEIKGWDFFPEWDPIKNAEKLDRQKMTTQVVLFNMTKIEEMDKYLKIGYMDRATRALVSRIPIVREFLPVLYRIRMLLAADPIIALLLTGVMIAGTWAAFDRQFKRLDDQYRSILRGARPGWSEVDIGDYIRERETNLMRRFLPG